MLGWVGKQDGTGTDNVNPTVCASSSGSMP